jgi:hypothetical protein
MMNPFLAHACVSSGYSPPTDCPGEVLDQLPRIEDDSNAALDWMLDFEDSAYITGLLTKIGCKHAGEYGALRIWKAEDGTYNGEYFAFRRRTETFKGKTLEEAVDQAYTWYVQAGPN